MVAHGVASYLHGKRLLVGSRHYLEHDEGVDLAPLAKAIAKQSALGRSLLYLAEDGKAADMLAEAGVRRGRHGAAGAPSGAPVRLPDGVGACAWRRLIRVLAGPDPVEQLVKRRFTARFA